MGTTNQFLLWFLRLFPYVRELERAKEVLEGLASTDPLTKLLNRRGYNDRFAASISLMASGSGRKRDMNTEQRHPPVISLVMLDIDHFKHVNDTHGHDAGDQVLVELAKRLRQARHLRSGDFVARFGGEEFLIVLPHTEGVDAQRIANLIWAEVRGQPFAVMFPDGGLSLPITVSVGVATTSMTSTRESWQVIARRLKLSVDAALYTAKETGRDRVVF